MRYFIDEHNEVYCYPIDGSQDHLIASGLTEVTAQEANDLLDQKRQAKEAGAKDRRSEILAELASLDQKKIRALTDALLGHGNNRLIELEQQQATLRQELTTLTT